MNTALEIERFMGTLSLVVLIFCILASDTTTSEMDRGHIRRVDYIGMTSMFILILSSISVVLTLAIRGFLAGGCAK